MAATSLHTENLRSSPYRRDPLSRNSPVRVIIGAEDYSPILMSACVFTLGGPNWDQHQHQKVDIPPEEQQKHWWDLDEKRKKELEVCRWNFRVFLQALTCR